MSAAERLALGVDLGGTKIEAVVGRVRGELGAASGLETLARLRVATESAGGYEHVVERGAALVRAVAADAGVALADVSIGVGMPGGVRRRDGSVKNCNATCLNGRPFRADLARALAVPVAFENDANCFALAEARMGAGAAFVEGVVFGVILGSGVGGGVVVGGRVWPGAQGIAGEWGHHVVVTGGRGCYCGGRGCLEAHASGPAVEADYERRSGVRRSLTEIAAARASDEHARAAFDAALDALARGLANLVDILDPSAIVLGGGVSNVDGLADDARARVAALVFNDELTTPIVRHALGDSAGVLGAAWVGLAAAAGASGLAWRGGSAMNSSASGPSKGRGPADAG